MKSRPTDAPSVGASERANERTHGRHPSAVAFVRSLVPITKEIE